MTTTTAKQLRQSRAMAEWRSKQASTGAVTIYTIVDRATGQALDGIMQRRICTKRQAIEESIKHYLAKLSRINSEK